MLLRLFFEIHTQIHSNGFQKGIANEVMKKSMSFSLKMMNINYIMY